MKIVDLCYGRSEEIRIAYIFLAISVALGASGHLLTKAALARTGLGFTLAVDPFVICGVLCYFLSFVAFMPWLSSRPAGVAVPAAGLTYAVVAIASFVFKGDTFSATQIIGIMSISFGVWALAT